MYNTMVLSLERKLFMIQRLEDVEKRYEELTAKISDPEEIAKTASS